MEYTPNRKFYKPGMKSALKSGLKKIAGKAIGLMPAKSPLDVGFLSLSKSAMIPGMIATIVKESYDNKKHLDLMSKNQAEARQRIDKENKFNQDPLYKFNISPRYSSTSMVSPDKQEPEDIQDIIDQGKPSSGGVKETPKPKSTGVSTSSEPDYLKQSTPNNISQGEPDYLKYSTPKEGVAKNFKPIEERKILTDFASFVTGKTPTGIMSQSETMKFIKQAKQNKDIVQSYFDKYLTRNNSK